MSNLVVAKRFADLLETGDVKGLQPFLAEDFRAKGPILSRMDIAISTLRKSQIKD